MCGIALIVDRVDLCHENANSAERLAQEVQCKLQNRGPDYFGVIEKLVAARRTPEPPQVGATWAVRLNSAVLHLRGDALVKQPLEDTPGNVLCWNGEVFGGASASIDEHDGNDTIWLSRALCDATSKCDAAEVTTKIKQVVGRIEGPFAFAWFHEATQRVYFGHDRFGRRSLLYHSTTTKLLTDLADQSVHEEGSNEQSPAVTSLRDGLPFFCLSSVVLSDVDGLSFDEVPSTGLFVLDLVEATMAFHPYEPLAPMDTDVVVVDRYAVSLPLIPAPSTPLETSANGVLVALSNAVGVRVRTIPTNPSGVGEPRVSVLFSGGLDSVVLAALAHFHLRSPSEPINLINVCFDSDSGFQSPDRQAAEIAHDELRRLFPSRSWNFVRLNVSFHDVLAHQHAIYELMQPCDTHMDFNIGAAFWFLARGHGTVRPDQETVMTTAHARDNVNLNAFLTSNERTETDVEATLRDWTLFESCADDRAADPALCPAVKCKRKRKPGCVFRLCRVCCFRVQKVMAKLVAEDVDDREKASGREMLRAMGLHETTNDLEAVFAAHGNNCECRVHRVNAAVVPSAPADQTLVPQPIPAQPEVNGSNYVSTARVLLVGIGADEQFGGYGRHRTAFRNGGQDALQAELALDMRRIWKRNLGRDDRCISAHGKEARFPFLDEHVVRYVASLPVACICDLSLARGVGDKLVLRLVARQLGLEHCTGLAKRAIQFGTRIAKHSNVLSFGSNRQATGDAKFAPAAASSSCE